jgi:hypothetical protein
MGNCAVAKIAVQIFSDGKEDLANGAAGVVYIW